MQDLTKLTKNGLIDKITELNKKIKTLEAESTRIFLTYKRVQTESKEFIDNMSEEDFESDKMKVLINYYETNQVLEADNKFLADGYNQFEKQVHDLEIENTRLEDKISDLEDAVKEAEEEATKWEEKYDNYEDGGLVNLCENTTLESQKLEVLDLLEEVSMMKGVGVIIAALEKLR